jgi:hypothetical protein
MRLKIKTILIKKSKKHLDINCVGIKFRDKDTNQHVFYIPSLNLSGYGYTPGRAKEMLDFTLEEFCTDLLNSTGR